MQNYNSVMPQSTYIIFFLPCCSAAVCKMQEKGVYFPDILFAGVGKKAPFPEPKATRGLNITGRSHNG